jgi:RNA 2',3'-cyclic 3'-phosphodiesterase
MASRRLFFALWPETAFNARLRAAARGLDLPGARAVPELDWHVTLCFLGAVEERLIPALCKRVGALRPERFELCFDALEHWPDARVLAASSAHTPAAARDLARALGSVARAVGLAPDKRPLKAHLTLARGVAAASSAGAIQKSLSPPLRFPARRFYLAQSHELEAATAGSLPAARYARLAAWALRAREP